MSESHRSASHRSASHHAASHHAASHHDPALLVHGISSGYGSRDVFRDVSLTLAPGGTLRITGRNAAGKSTLARCVAGAKPYRTGRVLICGDDLATDAVAAKRHLGYSTGAGPFTYLTGREHLRLAGRVHRLGRDSEAPLLDRFAGWAAVRAIDTEVRRYSHGMRQQLAVLLAVLHDPCLLVLDEAVDGLDEQTLGELAGYLHERAGSGRALVFVEHREEVVALFPAAEELRLAGGSDAPTETGTDAEPDADRGDAA